MTSFWEEYLASSHCEIELHKLPQSAEYPSQQVTEAIEASVVKSLRDLLGTHVEEGILTVVVSEILS